MRTEFEHEGDVRGVDLLACLVALWRESASGSLQFSRSGATAGFEIAGGEIVASSSSDPRFETAAILVRAGKLDTRTLERLAAPEGADRALLALQAGVLTRREYRWGEKIRAVEILSDLLAWLEGEYFFFRTTEAEREGTEPRLPIPRLVLELFLRSRDRSLVLKYLGGADVPLARAPQFDAEFATFGLTADAESVVRLIDGTSSAEQIASEAPAEAFSVEKLLAALVTLGLVHPSFAAGGAATERNTVASLAPAQAAREARYDEPPETDPRDAARTADGEDTEDEEAEEESSDEADEFESDLDEAVPVEKERAEWELGEDFEREPAPAESPMTDASFSGRPSLEPDLESAALAGEPRPSDIGGFDEPREPEGSGVDRSLDATSDAGTPEPPPDRRRGSPLLWVLAALVVAVGAVLWVRSRGAAAAPEGSAAAAPTATATEVPAVAAPPGVPASSPAPPTAAPASALPTRLPTAAVVARTRPTPRQASTKSAPTKPVPAPVPAVAPETGRNTSRQHWLDRAAGDAKRLAADRKTRYAIQLELVCEVESLADAFQHDHAGTMWVLTTSFQGRTCFRVLWGRYATIEAARRALPGAPRFFTTAKNHPAVTGVR
ncbi:MAG TPA: hypothetical protein VN032_05505 [Thermoanaerobaculia bacterium]|jgi:hypothetical protein|nr:hypothetical protein [Thermoanaerobaculia bacterium]